MSSAAKRILALTIGVGFFFALQALPRLVDLPALRGVRAPLLVAGLALAGVWLVAVLLVRVARGPEDPAPGPSTADLGPEPPAVANLLVKDFDVEAEAVPATLLDLAARG